MKSFNFHRSSFNRLKNYQDELASTSHVADASGNLLEYYRYEREARLLLLKKIKC